MGYYTCDPVFAETVREVAELGYQLAAYEQRQDQADPAKLADVPLREQAQAENLAALFKANPEGRFLIHVGYGHLRETPAANGELWMAARLTKETGIDPLTIEQSGSGSFGPHAPDSQVGQDILGRIRAQGLDHGSSTGWPRPRCAGRPVCDLAVWHPLLPDVDGRPGWLAADPRRRRKAFDLAAPSPDGLALIQAIHAAPIRTKRSFPPTIASCRLAPSRRSSTCGRADTGSGWRHPRALLRWAR